MRKLPAVLAILVVFGICNSSYGNYFLIYNVSTSVKGVNDVTPMSIPLKAYMLLTLDDDDSFVDINMVWYGKDANTPKKVPVYIEIGYDEGAGALDLTGWNQGDYAFLRLVGSGPQFTAVLSGKKTLKDVGFGTDPSVKKMVASKLKGVISVFNNYDDGGFALGPDVSQKFSGTANISATLSAAFTKSVNDTEPSWTADQIINGQIVNDVNQGIIPTLERKKFEVRTSPYYMED